MKKVTILQHRLLHYRVEFFEQLREILKARDIELNLVHGQSSLTEQVRKDEEKIVWAHVVKNRYWNVFGKDLCWQPFPASLKNSDLIVLMQENRILSNYPHLLRHFLIPNKRIAYWGHGANFQSVAPKGLREKWKSILLKQVDWWFAYTKATVTILRNANYPESRISCLNNAINTNTFREDVEQVSDVLLKKIKSQSGINDKSLVGLYCGSLYLEKRIDMLISASDLIYDIIPEFQLVVIGNGPDLHIIQDAIKTRPWIKWVGVKKGKKKAAYYHLAKVILNPGAVGLHVLDSFVSGKPMITTASAMHGPEAVYIENGINGFMTTDSIDDYATTVINLLKDPSKYKEISQNAIKSSHEYSLENMAHNFADGIDNCLKKTAINKND